MAEFIAPIQRLIEEFRRLPGVGGKSAARYAFAMLELTEEEAARFADAILGAKRDVHTCPVCYGLCTDEMCDICRDESRDPSLICVVENPKDVMVMESYTDHVPLESINKELSRHKSNSHQAIIMELSCEESCCSAGNNQAAEQAGITQHSWQLSSR